MSTGFPTLTHLTGIYISSTSGPTTMTTTTMTGDGICRLHKSESSVGRYRIQASFRPESKIVESVRLQRRTRIKAAFQHAWIGYKKKAWLHDEVLPVSGGYKDPFVGWAATLVDSLDTLWIMGLKDEFDSALKALEQIDFSKPNAQRVPVFEVTIRYLGGLLGAWDISGHKYPILLRKAQQLGDFLYGAFNTENGIPTPYYWWENVGTGKIESENGVVVAQIGSLSLEFIRLSQVTGDAKYADAIQKITDQLAQTQNSNALPGIWPSYADCKGESLSFSNRDFTLGAFADSLYEYLPKTHLLLPSSSSVAQQYLEMYRIALHSFSRHLFFRPSLPGEPDILYSGNANANTGVANLDTQIQHLSCFVGGMVGLGAKINNSPTELETATKLTNGCVWAYENTPSGIMPEIFHVDQCADLNPCTWNGQGDGFTRVDDPSYQLRPEAIESVFIMYRLTGDPSWQEKGWRMFESIERYSRTDIAHARLENVMDPNPGKADSMESFWLAETLKYFYLLFSEPELVSLDHYVLNTEAHPFRREG
ncbi:mannosyl-oligosaccharide alpha-1,2-mannosidase, putative [Talaromyces stipitatus ATCC 10500]|uniref:alpha-1,2-Mannosidase n=1 Tax=Talaromyces stipitatus (strain ATCC 10500 / CBS 375.48 / QM 6759 / NRRL 1006) TaxID=441959 RepID=B8M2P8_TALSN|nr:mannosyl-oligosaccharide alpha-1,2-mannosidase, putative [Talaromyces stipitatus ATCC 10500]EED21959.1 mannosyl-oligosaccharide alpha-1,2-mannosidase, putative [Talaromyces stipitatus ATCC 10500]